MTDHIACVSIREHFDALRAADSRYHEAMRCADIRFFDVVRAADARALAAALASTTKANEMLSEQYRSDKAMQNEWRATVTDIIGGLKGAMKLWGLLLALGGLALAVLNFLSKPT